MGSYPKHKAFYLIQAQLYITQAVVNLQLAILTIWVFGCSIQVLDHS